MIYMYNENHSAQWQLTEMKSPEYARVELINKPEVGMIFHIRDQKAMDYFKQENISITDCAFTTVPILDANTSIMFNKKNLRPTINFEETEKYNRDIYFASFDISNGERVINSPSRGAYIYAYHYDYENHQLHLIFSMNTVRVERPYLEVILMDDEKKKVYLRHFMIGKRNNEPCVVSRVMDMDGSIQQGERGYIRTNDYSINEGKDYRFHIYIPLRPTRLLVLDTEDQTETVKNLIAENFNTKTDNSVFLYTSGLSEEDLRSQVKEYVFGERFEVATYYMPEITHEEFKENREPHTETILHEKQGELFNIVFALCNDGWVVRVK